ncbi:MAG TPA: AAA family ATPase [Vineibacter sp.]|nr:AAA family ATPase [Vineibacter sp.]
MLVDRVEPGLFEGDYREIAERVVEYWRQYNKPPGGAHLFDLVENSPNNDGVQNRKAKVHHQTIVAMCELHASPNFNAQYAVDKLAAFHREQTIKASLYKMADRFMAGGPDILADVEQMMQEALAGRDTPGDMELIPITEFSHTELSFFWRPFFPNSMLSVLSAKKGLNKTSIIIDIASNLSQAEEPLYTLYLSKESGAAGVLIGLMQAAGGDPSRLVAQAKRAADGTVGSALPDKLTPQEPARLESIVRQYNDVGKPVGLIAIEPVNSFVDATKANQDAGMRELLDRLALLADRLQVMIIVSTHWNKNEEARVRDRIIGSVAVVNVARSVNVVIDDPEAPGRRLLINLIGNYADPGEENVVGFRPKPAYGWWQLEWESEEEMFRLDEDEVDAMVKRRPEAGQKGRPRKLERAKELLRGWLQDGELPRRTIMSRAKQEHIGQRTLEAAKKECGITARPRGKEWFWGSPPPAAG